MKFTLPFESLSFEMLFGLALWEKEVSARTRQNTSRGKHATDGRGNDPLGKVRRTVMTGCWKHFCLLEIQLPFFNKPFQILFSLFHLQKICIYIWTKSNLCRMGKLTCLHLRPAQQWRKHNQKIYTLAKRKKTQTQKKTWQPLTSRVSLPLPSFRDDQHSTAPSSPRVSMARAAGVAWTALLLVMTGCLVPSSLAQGKWPHPKTQPARQYTGHGQPAGGHHAGSTRTTTWLVL